MCVIIGGSVSIMDLSYGTSVPQRVSNARIVYTSPIIYYTTMHHPYTIMHDHLFALQHYRPSAGTVTAPPPTHTPLPPRNTHMAGDAVPNLARGLGVERAMAAVRIDTHISKP